MSTKTLLAQLVLSLKDEMSGDAKKAAGSLNEVRRAAGDLGRLKTGSVLDNVTKSIRDAGAAAQASGRSFDIFAGSFGKDLGRLKASRREIDEISAAWRGLEASMRSAGRVKASEFYGAATAFRNSVTRELSFARVEAEQLAKQHNSNSALARRFVGGATAVVGAAGIAHATRRTSGFVAKNAAIAQREEARDYLGGVSADDTTRISALALQNSSRFRSVDMSTLHELYRETKTSTGSMDLTAAVADPLARTLTVLQSIKGKESAVKELVGLMRGLDTLGKNVDPAEITTLLEGATRAAGVQGAEYNPKDIYLLAKRAKLGGFALSPEFLNDIAPSLMADMGAEGVGTALGSSVAQMLGGRATKESKSYQQKLGLRDKRGNFLQRDLFASNPFDYATKVLEPAMRKGGIDTLNGAAVVEGVAKLFSNQMVANLFGRMISQAGQIEKTRRSLQAAPGLKAADEIAIRDPFVAAEGALSQLRNSAALLADPYVPAATSALNAFSGSVAGFNAMLVANPEVAKQLGGAVGAAGAGGLGVGLWSGIRALVTTGSPWTSLGSAIRGGLGGGLVGAGVYSAYGLSRAATEAVKNNPEQYRPLVDNPMLGAMMPDYALGAAVYGQTGDKGAAAPPGADDVAAAAKAAKLRDLEAELRRAIARRQADSSNFGTTSPVGAGLAAKSDAQLSDLERMIAEAGGRVVIGGQEVGGNLAQAVAAGIAANASKAEAAAQTIYDRIRAIFIGGVEVPISVTPKAPVDLGPSVPTLQNTVPAPAPGKQSARGTGLRIGAINITGTADPRETATMVADEIDKRFQQATRGGFGDYGLDTA